jgi:hypothetical protein
VYHNTLTTTTTGQQLQQTSLPSGRFSQRPKCGRESLEDINVPHSVAPTHRQQQQQQQQEQQQEQEQQQFVRALHNVCGVVSDCNNPASPPASSANVRSVAANI